MAASQLMKLENPLEKYFRPHIRPESAYKFERVPSQNKTRKQRIEIERARHRNHCRKIKIDTEDSFEVLVLETKNVMATADHHTWKDLENRVNQANEMLWKIDKDLDEKPWVTEQNQATRMSKITFTIAGYLQTQDVDDPDIRKDMVETFAALKRAMCLGPANIPKEEHSSLISHLFKLAALTRKPKKMITFRRCLMVEKALEAYKASLLEQSSSADQSTSSSTTETTSTSEVESEPKKPSKEEEPISPSEIEFDQLEPEVESDEEITDLISNQRGLFGQSETSSQFEKRLTDLTDQVEQIYIDDSIVQYKKF